MVTLKKLWYEMSNKTDYAYAAGIIDGEGCIAITDGSPTNKGGQSWKISVEVSACSQQMVDKMVGILGGHRKTLSVRPCMHYVQYRWTLYGRKAYEALKKVKPYLTEKKAQADLATNFYIHQSRCKYYAGKKLSNEIISKRKAMQQRLKDLKTAFLVPVALAETECENAVMGEATVQPS